MTMKTQDDSAFSHDEADITMISYVLQAANQGRVWFMLSVMTQLTLSHWVHRTSLQCKAQMSWDGTILATCTEIGPKYLDNKEQQKWFSCFHYVCSFYITGLSREVPCDHDVEHASDFIT